ncbi:WXG100 family type VII secretion target [Paenibacillus xylanexedens]|uniref:WXG100 family type VII secretion target n=1 Tax=Paenibacillus xylanexedens TaxID=528191 RepID=UPI00119F3A18|nr:WXG100 family type VII secretion target [Paenibacillus xylanexedens]
MNRFGGDNGMLRIQVHPDELDAKARYVQQCKLDLDRIVRELDKSLNMLQSEWSGVTQEKFFWDFMEVKHVFPSTLGMLDNIQKEFTFIANNFRTTDSTGEVALYIPNELKPSFFTGAVDKAIGDTVTGLGETAEALIYNPLSTLGSLAYAMTLGKVVDAGRGLAFAWDAAWGNGTARSDIEQFVDEKKKQLDEDESGYVKGTIVGQALSYFIFGRALHPKERHESGGGGGGKKETDKESGLSHNGKIRMEGTKTIYTNSYGNEISWTNQGPKDLDAIIEKNLKSSIDGDILEGKVAQTVKGTGRLQGTAIQLHMKDDTKAGDIDVLTDSHLIEVKKSLSAVSKKQFNKLTDPMDEKFFNFNNREVIYYIEDTTVKNKTQENILKMIHDKGIRIISSTGELEEVMRK